MKNVELYAVAVILTCGFAFGQAQEKVLWSFAGPPNDGAMPLAGLVFDQSGNLYGTTYTGGNATAPVCGSGCGTIFELSPGSDGIWKESVLYNFCSNYSAGQCLDGAYPQASLVFDAAGNLYGTTNYGGGQPCTIQSSGCGTVFELSPPAPSGSWTQTVLYSFCAEVVNFQCLDGAVPISQLTWDASGNLYGTTSAGGTADAGTVFELSPDSGLWNEVVLYNFCSIGHGTVCPDGEYPFAGVTFDNSGSLYGTTEVGGSSRYQGGGTVYKLTPTSGVWIESVLIRFVTPYSDGRLPIAPVSFDAVGNLYGTTAAGGPSGNGGVFRLRKSGAEYFLFNGSNGSFPVGGVLVDSRRAAIYGTTQGGGGHLGAVFKITAPAQETVLYGFCLKEPCVDGAQPSAGLIEDRFGNLYSTGKYGGANITSCENSGCGVVFEIQP
jgi:uncharacterized repeat protein (TIGR03803 family)